MSRRDKIKKRTKPIAQRDYRDLRPRPDFEERINRSTMPDTEVMGMLMATMYATLRHRPGGS